MCCSVLASALMHVGSRCCQDMLGLQTARPPADDSFTLVLLLVACRVC
jgi:hypothetical protein